MTSGFLIALVGLIYLTVSIDLGLIQHRWWHSLIWFGYAVAQIGLWRVTIYEQ